MRIGCEMTGARRLDMQSAGRNTRGDQAALMMAAVADAVIREALQRDAESAGNGAAIIVRLAKAVWSGRIH